MSMGQCGGGDSRCPRAFLKLLRLVVALFGVALGWTTPADSRAQVNVVFEVADSATPTENKDVNRAFILPAQPPEVTEAIEDFVRYRMKETWEKAFKALEKVTSAAPKGLVARPDGILVPSRLLVKQALAELPPAGKNAYRIFHDAEAKNLLALRHARGDFLNPLADRVAAGGP